MTEQSTDGAIKLIDELRTDAKIGKGKHFNANRRKISLHNWVGIPVILINIFIGTVIIALLTIEIDSNILAIISAVLAFLAASLSGMQTFFNFHKVAEGHSPVGNRYLKISRHCKTLLRKHQDIPFTSHDLWAEVEEIQKEYLEINIEAEAFPTTNKDLSNARIAQEVTPFLLNNNESK